MNLGILNLIAFWDFEMWILFAFNQFKGFGRFLEEREMGRVFSWEFGTTG